MLLDEAFGLDLSFVAGFVEAAARNSKTIVFITIWTKLADHLVIEDRYVVQQGEPQIFWNPSDPHWASLWPTLTVPAYYVLARS